MTNELLPCPFCGGEAEETSVIRYGFEDDSSDPFARRFYVQCKICGVTGDGNVRSAEVARKAWNKRADHIPEMDRLKMAFMEWLRVYEKLITMRWEWLSVTECDTLGEAQWLELVKEYELFAGKRQREEQDA